MPLVALGWLQILTTAVMDSPTLENVIYFRIELFSLTVHVCFVQTLICDVTIDKVFEYSVIYFLMNQKLNQSHDICID